MTFATETLPGCVIRHAARGFFAASQNLLQLPARGRVLPFDNPAEWFPGGGHTYVL